MGLNFEDVLRLATAEDLRGQLPPVLQQHVLEWKGCWDTAPYGPHVLLRLHVTVDDPAMLWPMLDGLLAVLGRLYDPNHVPSMMADVFVREPGPAGDAREAAWRLSDGTPEAWMPPRSQA